VTALALGLVVFSAFVHASWNFVLKKSGGGTGLITMASLTSLAIYAPIVLAVTWYTGYAFKPIHLEAFRPVAPVVEVDGQDLFWWGIRTPIARRRLHTAIAAALS
jgi:hypothetical protein